MIPVGEESCVGPEDEWRVLAEAVEWDMGTDARKGRPLSRNKVRSGVSESQTASVRQGAEKGRGHGWRMIERHRIRFLF